MVPPLSERPERAEVGRLAPGGSLVNVASDPRHKGIHRALTPAERLGRKPHPARR